MLDVLRELAQDGRVETVKPNSRLWAITKATGGLLHPVHNYLAIDPGETTGIGIWDHAAGAIHLLQLETKDVGQGYIKLLALYKAIHPQHMRYEDYKVYSWKADDHSFASLHTAQFIGAIKVLAHLYAIQTTCLMAQHAKQFWTDEKLESCGVYVRGLKHARDAERHLLYLMTFNLKDAEQV